MQPQTVLLFSALLFAHVDEQKMHLVDPGDMDTYPSPYPSVHDWHSVPGLAEKNPGRQGLQVGPSSRMARRRTTAGAVELPPPARGGDAKGGGRASTGALSLENSESSNPDTHTHANTPVDPVSRVVLFAGQTVHDSCEGMVASASQPLQIAEHFHNIEQVGRERVAPMAARSRSGRIRGRRECTSRMRR